MHRPDRITVSVEDAILAILPERTHPYVSYVELTARELEVATLCAEGLTSQEIGHRLFISKQTVMCHRSNIMIKTGSRNITSAVAVCIRRGLI